MVRQMEMTDAIHTGQVHTTSRNLVRIVRSPAMETNYAPSQRQTYNRGHSSAHSQNVPVYADIVAPPHQTRNSTHNVSNGSLSSGRRGGSQLTQESLADYDSFQQPTNPIETYGRTYDHAGPYDAVGWIRSDGQVFDEDEVYEEYREYNYDTRNEAWR
jgi:hypothetical protein